MNDKQIRDVLADRLQCDDTISMLVHELGIGGGYVRADIAAIKRWGFYGYEIKSAVDTLSRLPRQVELYSEIFDGCTLVVDGDGRHLDKALAILPSWWSVVCVVSTDKIETLKMGRPNPNDTCLGKLWLLWKNEIVECLNEIGIKKGISRLDKKGLRELLLNHLHDETAVRQVVYEKLMNRDNWRKSND